MPDDTLKRSPFQTGTEDEQEKEELKRAPFATETLPTLPTTSGFLERLGLTPIEDVLPEEAPAPKRELATSPVIEEMKAKVEAEVEQGGIWKLRDEKDEVSKQFQVLEAEQLEAEAMKLPTGAMRDKRSLLVDVWNKKDAELQARRAAFEEKTGFTPDEYGRSEREIKLLRRQEIGRKLDRIEEEIDAGTTGPPSWEQEESWRTRKFLFLGGEHTGKDIFTRARDTDTASLLFGPSKRTEGDWRPLAKSSREGILPWKKGLDEAFWESYDSGPKDRNKGLKLLSGVMGAVFEGTPKTPLHAFFNDTKKEIDKSVAEVDKVYGKDSWQAKSWGVYAGTTATLINFADIMVGNIGGVATLGVGGALAKVAGAGKGTAAGTAAATTTAATEAAFATHILDGINQSLPQVLDTWYDPNASTKEKAEAVSGTVLAALFAVKLGHSSARTLEGALKSQYGIDINLETATRAELNNAGVRIVRVRENRAAQAEGREPITPKEGETLMEYATRVAAEKVLPKLKGEKQKTFNRIVGEQQALERMRLEERKSGEEIPVEETTIVEPILSERPVRPLLEAEPQPIVVPPEVLKFEPEPVDRRADAPDAPEAGGVEAYYDRPTLQVQPKDAAGVRQPDWTAAEAVEGKLPNVFYGTPNLKVRSAVELNFFRMTETKGGTGDIAEGYGRYATFLRDIAKEYYATGQKSGKEGNVYEYSLNFSRDTILDQSVAGGIKSQPEVVQNAWREFMDILNRNPEGNRKLLNEIKGNAGNATGQTLYRWIATYFTPKAQRMAGKWTPEGIYQGQVLASEFLKRWYVDGMTYKRSDIVHGRQGRTKHENIVILNPDKVRIVSVKNPKDVELLKDKAPFAFAPDKPTAPKEPVVEPVDPTDPRVMEIVEKLREEMTVEKLLARDAARDAKIAEALKPEPSAAEAPADLPSWEKKLLQTIENDITAKGWSELENGDVIRVEHEVAQGWLEGPLKDAKGKFAGVAVVIGEYGGKPTAGLRVESIEKLRKFIQDKGAEPAKPAAKAAAEAVVEDAKVVEATEKVVREEDALVEAAEEAAVAAEEVPSGMPKRMLKIVEREIAYLTAKGDARSLAAAGDLKVDPESFYNIFGSRRWADIISRMDKAEVDGLQAEMGGRGQEALGVLLEARQVEFKYEEWKGKEGDKNLKAVYLRAAQQLGENVKNFGQAVEAIKHNTHHTPEMIVDIIAAKQEQAVGGRKFTEEQRATLEGLVEKSQEAYKDLEKKQHKLDLKPTEENYEAARESLLKANEAAGEQAEFLIGHSPRLWSDLYVTALQGNLLTPQTLLLNVVGNIIPAPMRATSRITARSMELIGEYLFTKPSVREQRRIELQERREELKDMDKSAEGYIEAAAEVAKLEEAAMSNFMLQPLRGPASKARGFIQGIGVDKVWDALKAPKGTWGDLVKGKSERWRRHKYGGTDTAISSMLHGQRMRQYEAGVGEAAINPVSPIRALRKIVRSVTGKGDKLSGNEYAKAITELIQLSPSMMFKLLSAGDLPFRWAEFRRVIDNFGRRRGKAKGWTEAETKAWVRRAKESPELMLTEKENMALWNDASKATFQNENWLTDKVGKINQWFRNPMKKGAKYDLARAAYIPYRTLSPYQKTLLNITLETGAFLPTGFLDAKFNYGPKSFIYKKFGRKYAAEQKQLAYAKAITGTTLLGLYELMTQDEWRDDVIRADFSSGVTDKSAKIRHMTEDVVPDGTLNLSAFARGVRGFLGSDEKTTPQEGDNVINLQEFGVFGDILLTAAAYHEKKKGMTEEERKATEDNWFRGAFSLGGSALDYKSRQMFNRGMAQNLKQVVQGLLSGEEVGTWAKPFGRAITALAIPNTLDWFYNNSKDNPWRRDYRTTDVVEATAEGWARKLVAMGVKGEENPVLFDMWGRRIDRVRRGGTVPTFEWDASKWVGLPLLGVRKVNPRNQVDRYLYASFNIMRQGQLITDIHSSEIYRLWDDHRVDGIVPPIASRLMTIDETEYKLNRDQYAVLQRLNGMFRMSGPIVTVGPDEASGARGLRGGNWAGMRELISEGIVYRKPGAAKRLTTWKNLKPEVQVDEIKKMVSGSKSDARAYFLANFVKDKPNRIALITLAGLDLDRVGMAMMSKAEREKYLGKKEADAKKVIKGYSVNWDNLGFDKLEAVGEPSGKARKPLEK